MKKKILYSVFLITGLFLVLLITYSLPPDYRQGDFVKIMFVHVPSAWVGLLLYFFVSIRSFLFLKNGSIHSLSKSKSYLIPGFFYLVLCLFTGSLWARNIWKVHWVWDARTMSVFMLFLSYFVCIMIVFVLPHISRRDYIFAFFSICTLVLVPATHFSVEIFRTVHQGLGIQSYFRGNTIMPDIYIYGIMLNFIFFLLIALYSSRSIYDIISGSGKECQKFSFPQKVYFRKK